MKISGAIVLDRVSMKAISGGFGTCSTNCPNGGSITCSGPVCDLREGVDGFWDCSSHELAGPGGVEGPLIEYHFCGEGPTP